MSANFHPPPQRILVRSVNWLGDAVMTTPALLQLRKTFPNAHIVLLTPEKLKDLWLHHLAVNETISFTADESVFSVSKKLRAQKYDLALVLPNSPRSALEVFFARIPQRIGYARPWRNFLLTQSIPARTDAVKMQKRSVAEIQQLISRKPEARSQKPEIPRAAHQVFEYLNLTNALGTKAIAQPPQLFLAAKEIEAAKKKFQLANLASPVFGLNPGAEYGAAKRWPAEHFIAAAKRIQQQTNCTWLILGGKNDLKLATQIHAEIASQVSPNSPPINYVGQTSLRELMALLKICRVLLTNDTGPMHVAAALGTPVVVPFGSTSPELTGPISAGVLQHAILKTDVPCSPCFLRECPVDFRCMNDISVERVAAAFLKAIPA